MHPLRAHLQAVITALGAPAMAERIAAGDPGQLQPAASTTDLAALQTQLGRPLPATLRETLGQVTRQVEIVWSLPARQVPDPGGFPRLDYPVTPPDAFMEWDQAPDGQGQYPATARRVPWMANGGLRFSIQDIIAAHQALPGWIALYADNPDDDEDMREHSALLRDFMAVGFPVMTAPNGDWLAIDLRDADEHLLHVSHEGEEAGIEIPLTLPQFLAHQAWLGPIWPDFAQIFAFSDRVHQVVPDDPRITMATFDARGAKGRAWRNWFWAGAGLPDPADDLLGGTAT